MRETDAHYRKTAQFTEIVARITPGMPEVRVVDTRYLHGRWKMLSEYCHKQLWPQESFASPQREFQEAGFRLIEEVLKRFHEWVWESAAGIIEPGSLSGETKQIYEKFVKDELAADQVERMLRLMQPVLEQRARVTERGGSSHRVAHPQCTKWDTVYPSARSPVDGVRDQSGVPGRLGVPLPRRRERWGGHQPP